MMEMSTASPEAKSDETIIIPFPPPSTKKLKKKKMTIKNQRRFSDDQIRLLESIFESETRLEPRKKLQLAMELGLQPRQVAIWFQNRRARWKSKQVEHDYRTLQADYDNLASRFESLKQEKESLLLQLQELNEQLHQKPEEAGNPGGDKATLKSEQETNPRNFLEEALDHKGFRNDDRIEIGYSGEEGSKLQEIAESLDDGSEKPTEKWYGFEFNNLIDTLINSNSSSSYHWLNSWV